VFGLKYKRDSDVKELWDMSALFIRKELLFIFILIAVVVGSGPILAQDATPAKTADAAVSEKQNSAPVPPTKSDAQAKSEAPVATDPPAKSETADTAASTDDSLQQALKQMQAQLDAQNKEIDKLKAQYASEVDSRQKEIDKQDKQISAQTRQIAN
jgi:hypothetical protein